MHPCLGIMMIGLLAGCNLDLQALYGLNTGSGSDTTSTGQTTGTTLPGDTGDSTTVTSGPTSSTTETATAATMTSGTTVDPSETTAGGTTAGGTTAGGTITGGTTTGGTTADGTTTDGTTAAPPDCTALGSLLPEPPLGTRSFITDIALFPNNDFAITGAYEGDIGLGDLPANEAKGVLRAFVARVRCDGEVVWARTPEPCGVGDEVPIAVAVTGDGQGVAIAGKGGTGRPFLAWHDGSGVAKVLANKCFAETGAAYDLAPIDQDDILLGAFIMNAGHLLRFTKDGQDKLVDIGIQSARPVAMAVSADYVYLAFVVDYHLQLRRFNKDLSFAPDAFPYLGFDITPIQNPPLDSNPPNVAIALFPEKARLAVAVVGGDGNIAVLVNKIPKDNLDSCLGGSVLVVVDTEPFPVLKAAQCVAEPYHLRTLLLTADDKLAFGGLVPGMPPTPAWGLSNVLDMDPGAVVPAAVQLPTAGASRGELARMFDADGKWIVGGGFSAQSMALLGADFQAQGDLNLFLGRVEPQ